MAWNGSGVFTRTNGSNTGATLWSKDKNAAIKITSIRHDDHDQDLANGINNCLTKDGQNAATADIDMGGNVFLNYGAGNSTLPESSTDSYLPEITTSNADGTINHIEQVGFYSAVGDIVIANINVIATISGSPTGSLQVSLPIQADGTGHGSGNIGLYQGITTDNGLYAYIDAGATNVTFQKVNGSDDYTSSVLMTDVGSTVVIRMTATYQKV